MVVGDSAPNFELPDTSGEVHSVPAEPAPPATVLVQTCNHCPYVIAWNPRLRAVAEEYAPRGVRFLAFSSNDAERYPADSPERMAQFVREHDWPIPYAFDESQEVAHALDAVATPHVFVFDSEHRLVYQGAPDADHQDPSLRAEWLRAALDAVLEGGDPPADTEPVGCSIKWR